MNAPLHTATDPDSLPTPGTGKVRVAVPATAANLGPGFDVLGLALSLFNYFDVAPAQRTTFVGDGYATSLPSDETNLFYKAFAHLHSLHGRSAPPISVRMTLNIPPGRGLGSSATAVVGGLMAAQTLMGLDCNPRELLSHAVQLEHGRHPDNVAPALLGGLVACALDGDTLVTQALPFPEDLSVVLFIPDFEMDTVAGRGLMPASYSRGDVVFNTGRVALLAAALAASRYELLRAAMQDRLHQPYREKLFPLLPDIIEAATGAGAHGACLSGGGSTVLALTTDNSQGVGEAMRSAGSEGGVNGEVKIVKADRHGARVLHGEEEKPE